MKKSIDLARKFLSLASRDSYTLKVLLDLLKDHKLPVPANEEQLEYLTPYAILWRYDFDSSESLAREHTMDVVKQVFQWAENQIALVHEGLGNE